LDLAKKSAYPSDTIMINVKLKNTGDFDGDEVIQVYSRRPANRNIQPLKSLVAFQRVTIKKGEERTVSIPLAVKEFRQWDYAKEDYSVVPGMYDLFIGASSADIRLQTRLQVLNQ
jgi:beta-glucosidase